ncbi:MAG: hypothetical protein ACREFI_01100, partial [Stellaceae bacterium]
MGRISASASRRDAGWRAAIVIGVFLWAPLQSAAAQTMVFGGSTAPDVVVNENVLDALGPPPTLPGLMRQENATGVGPSGLRPFSLHPPRARRVASAPRPKREDQARRETETQEAAPVAETAIPLGKSRRAARTKPSPASPTTADVGAATTPPKVAPPRPQPTQSAAASTSAPPPVTAPAAPAAAPSAPISSIVRRYPAGTGAAMLAASNPPPAPPSQPRPSPAPATSTPP